MSTKSDVSMADRFKNKQQLFEAKKKGVDGFKKSKQRRESVIQEIENEEYPALKKGTNKEIDPAFSKETNTSSNQESKATSGSSRKSSTRKALTIVMDPDLRSKLKVYCARHDVGLSDLIEHLARTFLSNNV